MWKICSFNLLGLSLLQEGNQVNRTRFALLQKPAGDIPRSLWRPLLQEFLETGGSICSSPQSQEWVGLRITQETSVISSLCKSESRCLQRATVNSDMAGRRIHFRTESHSRRHKYWLNSQGFLVTLTGTLRNTDNSKLIREPFGTSKQQQD